MSYKTNNDFMLVVVSILFLAAIALRLGIQTNYLTASLPIALAFFLLYVKSRTERARDLMLNIEGVVFIVLMVVTLIVASSLDSYEHCEKIDWQSASCDVLGTA